MERRRLDGSELVAALGLVFVVSGVTLWWESRLPASPTAGAALYELVVHVLFGGVVLALGVHMERSELSPDERFTVMTWCFSAFLFFLGLAVWSNLSALFAGRLAETFVSDVVVFGSMGGAFGVIAGINHGRSVRNARLAERNEEQRETLVLLTRLLRHDIRNDMTAIRGHAEFVESHVEPEGEESIGVLRRRSESVIRLLDDTDTLIQTLDGDHKFETVNLSTVLDDQMTSVTDDNPETTVMSEVPDELWVVADGLVHQVFSNLFGNAVAHNDPEELTIRVRAVRDGDVAEITVADDGGGISEEVRDSIFELGRKGPESGGDGLGLYLVSRLTEVYSGSIAVDESRDGGARFVITLPAATASDG